MMTLAVLALLVVLALSFTFTAQVDRQSSAVASDLTKARLLCESGLERVTAAMSLGYQNASGSPAPPNPPEHTYPARDAGITSYVTFVHCGSGQHAAVSRQGSMPVADTVGLEAPSLQASLQVPGVDDPNIYAALALIADRSWQHVKDNGKLTGRLLWAVLDEGGKIDVTGALAAFGPAPSAPSYAEEYVDHDPANGQFDAGEFYFDANGNGVRDGYVEASMAPPAAVRIGGTLQELRLSQPLFYTGIASLSSPRWFSLAHLSGALGAAWTTSDYLMYCADSYDIEAYWDAASATDRQRFDLSGLNWGAAALTWPSGPANSAWVTMANSTAAVDWLVAGGAPFWVVPTPASGPTPAPAVPYGTANGGIAWLTGMVDDDGLDVSKQVAANIIDYSDADGVATTDFDPATGIASYCGLEKAAYVNEVAFLASYVTLAIPPPIAVYLGDFMVAAQVEIANIYSQPWSGSMDLTVDFEFGGAAKPPAVPAAYSLVATGVPAAAGANSIPARLFAPGSMMNDWNWSTSALGAIDVRVVKVVVVLRDSTGAVVDVATKSDPSVAETLLGLPTNPPFSRLVQRSISMQVADPRANTLNKHWVWDAAWTPSLGAGTPGAANPLSDPSVPAATKDPETVATVVDGLSTAFIRDAPMRSLWELGAIHRGGPFQTLNLRAYSAAPGSYVNGDAGILDQVKLGPGTYSIAKFNANSPSRSAWRALLAGVAPGDAYDTPTYTTSALTDTVADALTPLSPVPARDWTSRGEAAIAIESATAASLATDREREAFLGKVANFLTVRQNIFTVLAVAQVVKDTGTVDPVSNSIEYDTVNHYFCARLAEQRMVATVYRDALANRYRVLHVEFVEE